MMDGDTRSTCSVAVVDAPSGGYVDDLDIEQKILGSGAVRKYLIPPDRRDVLHGVEEPFIILWHHVSLDAEFFEKVGDCRAVICASVGFNHVDVAAARRRGTALFHIPHYGSEEVADHTLALLLASARGVPGLAAHVRDGGWQWQHATGLRRLRGATLGIVGLGRIGTAVAIRAKAFGMRVAFYDPDNHPGIEKALDMVRAPTLHDLLAEADVVSLHTPLDERTHHMIGPAELALMRPGSLLVNTARGPLIDVEALRPALDEGRPGSVALDVVEHEPALPGWLRDHPQVLLTPHAAFYSVESLVELRTRAARAALELVNGSVVTAAVPVRPSA